MSFLRSTTIALTLIAGAVHAETLSGAEVAQRLGQGDLVFVAGSVAQFRPDNTYTFRHANGQQSGSYTLYSNGTVMFEDNGTEYTFIMDRAANGTLTVQYTGGPWRGESYQLR